MKFDIFITMNKHILRHENFSFFENCFFNIVTGNTVHQQITQENHPENKKPEKKPDLLRGCYEI